MGSFSGMGSDWHGGQRFIFGFVFCMSAFFGLVCCVCGMCLMYSHIELNAGSRPAYFNASPCIFQSREINTYGALSFYGDTLMNQYGIT